MLTVNKLLPGGRGLASALVRRAPALELDWDRRRERRFECSDAAGRRLAVDLPPGPPLRGGDVLVAEDGSLLRVVADAQPVLTVRAADGPASVALLRATYELGQAHVPLQLQPDALRMAPDAQRAERLRALGLDVAEERAPFEPEGEPEGHGHAHADDHGHGHAHPAHGRHAEHGHEHGEAHGASCGHDHGHDHGPGHEHDDSHRQGHGHDRGPASAGTTTHGQAAHTRDPASAAQRPTARGRPVGVPVAAAPAPHVHGPGCGHGPHEH